MERSPLASGRQCGTVTGGYPPTCQPFGTLMRDHGPERDFAGNALGCCISTACLFLPQSFPSHNRSVCLTFLGAGDDGVRLASSPRSSAVRTRHAVPAATSGG